MQAGSPVQLCEHARQLLASMHFAQLGAHCPVHSPPSAPATQKVPSAQPPGQSGSEQVAPFQPASQDRQLLALLQVAHVAGQSTHAAVLPETAQCLPSAQVGVHTGVLHVAPLQPGRQDWQLPALVQLAQPLGQFAHVPALHHWLDAHCGRRSLGAWVLVVVHAELPPVP